VRVRRGDLQSYIGVGGMGQEAPVERPQRVTVDPEVTGGVAGLRRGGFTARAGSREAGVMSERDPDRQLLANPEPPREHDGLLAGPAAALAPPSLTRFGLIVGKLAGCAGCAET
jgi:hypothetical protein